MHILSFMELKVDMYLKYEKIKKEQILICEQCFSQTKYLTWDVHSA